MHERVGFWLGRRLGLPGVGGLRPDDFGEMMVAATVGAALLGLLAVAWWRDRESTWRLSRELLILTAALAVCGVVIDAVHTIAFFRAPQIADPLAFLEDGGELLVISALTAYALDSRGPRHRRAGRAAAAGARRVIAWRPRSSMSCGRRATTTSPGGRSRRTSTPSSRSSTASAAAAR